MIPCSLPAVPAYSAAPLDFLLLMLASSFQRTLDLPSLLPLFRVVENGCKGTTFFHSRKPFFTFFSKNFLTLDYQYFINAKKETHLSRSLLSVSFSLTTYSAVMSTIGASGAFFMTEAMPLSMFFSLAYIWLEPTT